MLEHSYFVLAVAVHWNNVMKREVAEKLPRRPVAGTRCLEQHSRSWTKHMNSVNKNSPGLLLLAAENKKDNHLGPEKRNSHQPSLTHRQMLVGFGEDMESSLD